MSDDESAGSSMPDLLHRNANDDLSSSDSDIPELAGGGYGSSSDSEDDDDLPPGFGGDSDSSDDDSSQPPDLLPRKGNDEDDNSASSVDLPPLEPKNNDSDDSSDNNGSDSSDDDSSATSSSSASSSSQPKVPKKTAKQKLRAKRLKEEMDKAKKLRPSKLKRRLEELGVDPKHFLEKSELVKAYANALIDRESKSKRSSSDQTVPPSVQVVKEERPPVDPFANLPQMVPAKDPPKGGVWILSSDGGHSTLHYAFAQNGQVDSRLYGRFSEGSSLVPRVDSDTFVYASTANGRGEISCVKEMDLVFTMYQDVAPDGSLVTDGRQGLWALRRTDTSNKQSQWNLFHVNNSHPAGELAKSNVPSATRLILSRPTTGVSVGVWLVVAQETADASTMQPGIWYVTMTDSRRVVAEVHKEAFIASDCDRRGLWILEQTEDSDILLLTHVAVNGERQVQEVEVDFTYVQALVCTTDNELFIHYKTTERWKLCTLALGRRALKELADCPRNSQVTSHGVGVWIWKKIGKASERSLLYLGENGRVLEYSHRFPSGSTLGAQ
jgi:hypothetical protein